ncbi:ATP synthase F1 subunit delta [candidate division KSB1 bacterium]
MIAESLSRRYALALFNITVDRNQLEEVRNDFQVINDLLESKRKFRYFLYSPKVNRDEKKRIMTEIFKKEISVSMLHFIFLLLDKKRQTLLLKIFGHFMKLYDNHHNRATITVRPAVSLDDTILEDIRREFESILKKKITLEEKVDPVLIGGLQVRVNNTVYDASVLKSLRMMRNQII